MSCNPFKPKKAEWDKDFTRSKIVAKDPHSSPVYKAANPSAKNFNLFKVDGNLIHSTTQGKCDFLLIEFQRHQDPTKDCIALHSYFIELKGTDLKKATEQVYQSMLVLHPTIATSIPHARIVLKKVHTLAVNSSEVKRLTAFVKQKGGTYAQYSFNDNSTPEVL